MSSVGPASSVEDVVVWLRSLTEYVGDTESTAELFEDGGIDGSLLSTITAEELEALVGISDADEVAAILAARDLAFAAGLTGWDANILQAGPTSGSQRVQPVGGSAGTASEPRHPPLYRAVKKKDVALVLQILADGVDPNHPAECTGQSFGPGGAGKHTSNPRALSTGHFDVAIWQPQAACVHRRWAQDALTFLRVLSCAIY
jgi:hypothetical protein